MDQALVFAFSLATIFGMLWAPFTRTSASRNPPLSKAHFCRCEPSFTEAQAKATYNVGLCWADLSCIGLAFEAMQVGTSSLRTCRFMRTASNHKHTRTCILYMTTGIIIIIQWNSWLRCIYIYILITTYIYIYRYYISTKFYLNIIYNVYTILEADISLSWKYAKWNI